MRSSTNRKPLPGLLRVSFTQLALSCDVKRDHHACVTQYLYAMAHFMQQVFAEKFFILFKTM